MMEKMNQEFLKENEEADNQLQILMDMQRELDLDVLEEPVYSIEGQKVLEKEKKRKKKIKAIYDIDEDDREDQENSDEEFKDEESVDDTVAIP